MYNVKKNIVLYIGHTYDLAYFSRLIPLINESRKFNITSIVVKGRYFDKLKEYKEILDGYSDVIIEIPRDQIPIYSPRILRSLKFVYKLRKRMSDVNCRDSLFISHDKSQFVANYLLSRFNKAILIQTLESNNLKNSLKLSLIRMFYYNLLNILSGSKLIVLKEIILSKKHAWHFRILNPHFNVIYRNNKRDIDNTITLPSLNKIEPEKKILIFGGRFTEWPYLENNREKYISIIKSFYQKLYNNFQSYEFFYKPHPKEIETEYTILKPIFDNKIINLGNSLNSELYLLRNRDISYCFSICSTSSLSAFEMGFNSRVFYKLLELKNGIEKANDDIYFDMPSDFFINSLEDNLSHKCNTQNDGRLNYITNILNKFYKRSI